MLPTTNVCITCAQLYQKKKNYDIHQIKYPYLDSLEKISVEWFYLLECGVEPDWANGSLSRNEEEARLIDQIAAQEFIEEEDKDTDA